MVCQSLSNSNPVCVYPKAEVETALESILGSQVRSLPKVACAEIFKAAFRLQEGTLAFSTFLNNHGEMLPECLKTKFTQLKVSLLHLGALKGSEPLIAELCGKGINPNAKDASGNTALHLVAMTANRELFDRFPNLCPEIKVNEKNQAGAKAEDYFDFVEGTAIRKGSVYERFEQAAKIDSRCFPEGITPTFKYSIEPQYLLEIWSKAKSSKEQSSDFVYAPGYLRRVSKAFKAPPKLEVRFINEKIGCGLFASEDIQAGAFLTPYFGKCLWNTEVDKVKNEDYIAMFGFGKELIDSYEKRGLAALANDGPPNAAISMVGNQLGLSAHSSLIALSEIKKGSQVLVNYGDLHALNGKYPASLPDHPQFFEDFNIENYFSDIAEFESKTRLHNPGFYDLDSNFQMFVKHLYAKQAIFSTMVRPLVFLKLVELGKLKKENLEDMRRVVLSGSAYSPQMVEIYNQIYTRIFDTVDKLSDPEAKALYLNALKKVQESGALNKPVSNHIGKSLLNWANYFISKNIKIEQFIEEKTPSTLSSIFSGLASTFGLNSENLPFNERFSEKLKEIFDLEKAES